MRRHGLRLLLAAIALLSATPALAIDASYYTYDGFSETVDAFRLVSLIFADPRYETLVVVIATAGIGLGALLASVRGQAMGLVAFGFQMLVGIGLFSGMIATTGTVHVYDKVRNAYQPVGGVPNLLVLVAGTTNLIERALVEIVDDNTLDPDARISFGAGGHAFDLFFNAVSPRGPMTDIFLDASIKDYLRQCYPVARVSPAYGVDDDRLFRTTTDLPTAFAAMAGPATFSTVYSASDKAGTTMSCEDAWSRISDRLSDPALFDSYVRQICAQTGFDATQPPQLARCKSQLGEMGGMMMGTALPLQRFLTGVLLGTSVGDVLFEDSPATAARVMANRAILSTGLATMSVANEWMPTVRAAVFAIMLFLVPVALLFLLTPINLRVASFTLGLFVFVALWGVIDAGIYQLILGRAVDALADMRSNALAANAWALAPSSAQKALAIFGSFRTAAAGMAGAFVFTVFRLSGETFNAITGATSAATGQATAAAAPLATPEGYASALESQASATGTMTRRAVSSGFGDFGERTSFASDRAFGAAGSLLAERGPGFVGVPALGFGAIDAAHELGGLAPALMQGAPSDPAVQRAVRANAATAAIHQFAEQDALRSLGTTYFGAGQRGERAFAAFAQSMVQWRAFGDQRAYDMMLQTASRHFERSGYSPSDAAAKASGVIAQAAADPTFAKLSANTFDQEQMLANDLTAAQVQAGAMAGRRDFAGEAVADRERLTVATEQARRFGDGQGLRDATGMLGLSVEETGRRVAFITALSGEARADAITQLARATGRNEAQVMHALESYGAASQLGTADGATTEAAREGTSIYGRARELAGYDFAERAGKLDAQEEVGLDGTRSAARIGEQRRQADAFGFAEGAAAAGVSTREAARLDSFIQTLGRTVGNQLDLAEGGPAGVADRATNERQSRIVQNQQLTRMQALLRGHGVTMSKRDLAISQAGDLAMNVSSAQAGQLLHGGLISQSQFGAIAQGGHIRFSFARNDALVSSSAGYEQSARSDTSTRFEAGKQAGPDTIEHFLGGGAAGHRDFANWLRGGFEMDRKGQWRLKPQVADTLQRDVQAIMAQTGWQRSLSRSAEDQNANSSTWGLDIGGQVTAGGGTSPASKREGLPRRPSGHVGGSIGLTNSESGQTSESAAASMDIVNFDVRSAIAIAERVAARSQAPERAFSVELSRQVLGENGLRNRYLGDAASGRGTFDLTAPITSLEQSSILRTGRLSTDLDSGAGDSNPDFTTRKD